MTCTFVQLYAKLILDVRLFDKVILVELGTNYVP